MKKLLFIVAALTGISGNANADCGGSVAYGQYKQNCNNSENFSNPHSIEYTEIPYNANVKISKEKTDRKNLASLEKSVTEAQTYESPFKPTHTQLDQVKQLLEYANSQGCTWGGKHEKPLLICPE